MRINNFAELATAMAPTLKALVNGTEAPFPLTTFIDEVGLRESVRKEAMYATIRFEALFRKANIHAKPLEREAAPLTPEEEAKRLLRTVVGLTNNLSSANVDLTVTEFLKLFPSLTKPQQAQVANFFHQQTCARSYELTDARHAFLAEVAPIHPQFVEAVWDLCVTCYAATLKLPEGPLPGSNEFNNWIFMGTFYVESLMASEFWDTLLNTILTTPSQVARDNFTTLAIQYLHRLFKREPDQLANAYWLLKLTPLTERPELFDTGRLHQIRDLLARKP